MNTKEPWTFICPIMSRGSESPVHCVGHECKAWEPVFEKEKAVMSLENEIPEGWQVSESWEVTLTVGNRQAQYHRYVPTDEGDCGLLTKECDPCRL